MKHTKSILRMVVLLMMLVVLSNGKVQAQSNPGGPGSGQGGGGGAPDDLPGGGVPFDGGMSIMLLASGISYGYKKVIHERGKKEVIA